MRLSFFSNKPYWLQFCYLLLFIICGLTIFSTLALLTGKIYFGTDLNSRYYLYVTQFINSSGIFLLPALLFSYCTCRNCFLFNESHKIPSLLLILYIIVLSVLILPIVACLGCFNEQITFPESMKNIEMWMREMEESNKAILQTLIENSNIFILLLNIIMLALLPAMFEEFLFRGTLQPFFTQWLRNKSLAIIITAFIFSAIHFQFYGFLPRFFLGIYLGYLFIWGKSLWIPIIAHFMHNTNSLILNYILQQNDIDIDAIELNQISEFYPVVIFCTFSIVFFIYMLWKKYTKNVNQG